MEDILKAVETSGAIENVPQLWSHIVLFDHNTRENLLELITRIMIQNKPDPAIKQQEHLVENFGAIAYDIWSKIEEKNEVRSNPFVWTAKLLGDIILLLCRVGEFDRAVEVFERLSTEQHKILGEPDFNSLTEFVNLCIEKKQPSKAISCLQYASEIGFPESRELAKSICLGFTLDENHTKKVAFLAGTDVLEEAEKERMKPSEQASQ